ncbi:MAG: hypothetical protein OEL20_05160 [Sulfuritalea sp.]|nr:hypothetical protein [Sulfuritalea sp.]
MNKYLVAITKTAVIEVEGEDRAAAERIARDKESDGIVAFDMEVGLRPIIIGDHSIHHWLRRLDDECDVSVYEAQDLPGHFGFTGGDADDFASLEEAVEAAVVQYGLIETTDGAATGFDSLSPAVQSSN